MSCDLHIIAELDRLISPSAKDNSTSTFSTIQRPFSVGQRLIRMDDGSETILLLEFDGALPTI